ncbi:MAG TPA: recombinase family protein, partial [Tenuifilaceae bacterium]|nr:recombinase family protein [Tenuifilaceae bacterium]
KHLILEFAQKNQILVNDFVEIEISSRKDKVERRIDFLIESLEKGDVLLVAELSRLGRNMLETLNIINELSEKGIVIKFIRQPELSTDGNHTKLLLAIYSYFAESEREFISLRTKQGLNAAKASGKRLGRPAGSGNKKGRVLDPYKDQIFELLRMGLPISSVAKIINNQSEQKFSYNNFKKYIKDNAMF